MRYGIMEARKRFRVGGRCSRGFDQRHRASLRRLGKHGEQGPQRARGRGGGHQGADPRRGEGAGLYGQLRRPRLEDQPDLQHRDRVHGPVQQRVHP